MDVFFVCFLLFIKKVKDIKRLKKKANLNGVVINFHKSPKKKLILI